jgi:transposase
MMHRAPNLWVRQRTMAVNALCAHFAEFGVIALQGLAQVEELIAAIEENKVGLPELARSILQLIAAQLKDTQAKIGQIEARLAQWHRGSRLSKLLATVPGVGIMGASAIAAKGSRPRNATVPECWGATLMAGRKCPMQSRPRGLPRRGYFRLWWKPVCLR